VMLGLGLLGAACIARRHRRAPASC
jgi:hypothetical protein